MSKIDNDLLLYGTPMKHMGHYNASKIESLRSELLFKKDMNINTNIALLFDSKNKKYRAYAIHISDEGFYLKIILLALSVSSIWTTEELFRVVTDDIVKELTRACDEHILKR